jgi:hypothetical protein
MTDTAYSFTLTVASLTDDGKPAASNISTIKQTVKATKQSMTRYIGLEINDFINQITTANNAGYNTSGLLPLYVHPLQMKNNDTLTSILGGDLTTGSKDLATEINLMQAAQKQLATLKLPATLLTDWNARVAAMLKDATLAQGSAITSGP